MYRKYSILLTLALTIITGCSSSNVVVKPSPTATPIALSVTQSTISIQAWGTVHVGLMPITNGNMTFEALSTYKQDSITDDDQLCGNTAINYQVNKPQNSQLALLNLHTGVVTNLHPILDGSYLSSCAATGSWIIWSQSPEESDNPYYSTTWQVIAMNRQTKEVRTLDSSNGHYSRIPLPSASNGWAVWTSQADDQQSPVAMLYDFASGKKITQSKGTRLPQISWPWACWGDPATQSILFQNMETQQHVLLPISTIGTISMNGNSIVAADNAYSTITLYPSISSHMSSTSSVVGQKIGTDFVQFPTLNDRLVTWQSDYSLYVYDRKLQQSIAIFGKTVGYFNPFVDGHYLIWQTPGKDLNDYSQTTLDILDTNTLP